MDHSSVQEGGYFQALSLETSLAYSVSSACNILSSDGEISDPKDCTTHTHTSISAPRRIVSTSEVY